MELSEQRKKDYQLKIKKAIQELFNQMKNGCYRRLCYNKKYCKKNPFFKYDYISDKQLISDCLSIVKTSDVIEDILCIDFRCMNKDKSIDNNSLIDIDKWIELEDDQGRLNPILIKEKEKVKQSEIYNDIVKFNESYKIIIKSLSDSKFIKITESIYEVVYKNKEYIYNILLYLYRLYFNLLNYILLSNEFMYNIENKDNIKSFIDDFLIIKNTIDLEYKQDFKYLLEYFTIFNKNDFNKIISNLQNFLTILLVYLTSQESMTGIEELTLLVGLMRVFEVYWIINLSYDYISKELFHNDSVNNYLSVKSQCNSYFKYHKDHNKLLSIREEVEIFSFIRYYFVYNISSKKDIITQFNLNTQTKEIFSSSMNVSSLESLLYGMEMPYLIIKVRRSDLIEDTLNIIIGNFNFRKPLKVKFNGEQGVDEGGVKKEFFMLLVRQLFDPNYGMFNYNHKKHFFWFNLFSFESISKFELIGILFGLAIYNDVIIDVKFPGVIYKKLLGIGYSFEDMKEIDEDLYNNLLFLKNCNEENLEEVLGASFEIEVENFGNRETVELKEGGKDILISQSNKDEYIKLYIEWFFDKSISRFYQAFHLGFYRVCDINILKIIDEKELELIICGTKELNFNDLKTGCTLTDGYDESSETINYFWEIVSDFDNETKKKFLFFLTGCDRSPVKGLSSLNMIIGRYGPDSDKIPCAHTCFNYLLLPDYKNKAKLRSKLEIAIENSEGFGLQ